jgi:serine/threonine-protein kinase
MATFGRYTALRAARRYREGLWMLDAAKSELSRDGLVYHPKSLMRADFYYGLGDVRQARAQFEVARKTLADSSAAQPDDASIHAALGLAYAGLGQKREAIGEAERAMDLVRVSGNSLTATAFMGLAVEVFARVGELDRAFEMIELLRTMPSGREITVPFLRVWPGFDPLRKIHASTSCFSARR